jgi:hypothetical protein
MKTLFIIALFGLVASGAAHLSTFFGIIPQQVCPSVWWLHILIFVVWIPLVFSGHSMFNREGRNSSGKLSMEYSPGWMRALSMMLFLYAIFNFFYTVFVLNEGGVPSELNGKKVLHNHGKIIAELSDSEYKKHQAYGVRTFSGHWMCFYALAMTMLYSKIRHDSNTSDTGA